VADDPVSEARIVLKLARVQGWLDRYANALRWISKGLRILEGEEGGEASLRRAELLGWYGRFCQEEGHHGRAIKWCSEAVEQAEITGGDGKARKEILADALRVIDWAKMDLGLLEAPTNWERALALFEEIDDLSGAASVLNMLGGFAYFRGDWDEALALYRRAQVTDRRTGNAVNDAFYIFNIGEIALDQGHLDEAEEHFETASRAWRAAGYRSGAADVKGKLGRVATARGLYDDALALFEECIQELREVGSHGDILEAQARMTECLLYGGRLDEALAMADDSLALARSLGGTPPQVAILQRVRGAALARNGQRDAARQALEQSLQAAQLRRAEYEAALTMRVMARSHAEPDSAQQAALEEEAAAILSKLGVVWTPDPLATDGSVGSPPSVLAVDGPEAADSVVFG
jgi:tetratricopeptide (TPR) repeat protein